MARTKRTETGSLEIVERRGTIPVNVNVCSHNRALGVLGSALETPGTIGTCSDSPEARFGLSERRIPLALGSVKE
jgi:hypothetical protein